MHLRSAIYTKRVQSFFLCYGKDKSTDKKEKIRKNGTSSIIAAGGGEGRLETSCDTRQIKSNARTYYGTAVYKQENIPLTIPFLVVKHRRDPDMTEKGCRAGRAGRVGAVDRSEMIQEKQKGGGRDPYLLKCGASMAWRVLKNFEQKYASSGPMPIRGATKCLRIACIASAMTSCTCTCTHHAPPSRGQTHEVQQRADISFTHSLGRQ